MKKVLFLAANPTSTGKLAIDKEIRDIEEGIQLSHEKKISLTAKLAVRAKDIRRAIMKEKPTIVHFSGHGSKLGGLAVESDKVSDTHKIIKPKALAGLFKLFAPTIECVVLNACYSEKQAVAINQHIRFVIGTNEAIEDAAALTFSLAFYEALSERDDIQFAFDYGKNALLMDGFKKIDMLELRINKLKQTVVAKKKAVSTLKTELNTVNAALTKEKQTIKTLNYEQQLIAACPFPEVVAWLEQNKQQLAKKMQQSILPTGKEIRLKSFRGEWQRHLELLISNLLFDDRSCIDEPNLHQSFPTKIYQQGFEWLLNRIPLDRFSKVAYERVKADILYLINRL